ncbi:MAG TPA: Phenylacetic acid catabolic protein, partial [Fodinibius sp.]|nr:Phenylacetic acid catabolic protein [Fodinibius sp.]
ELFYQNEIDEFLQEKELAADSAKFESDWKQLITETLDEATIGVPDFEQFMTEGSRNGLHTEYLGPLLAEMQHLRRSYPDANWE